MATATHPLGAPGIYTARDEIRRTLGAERMDVCGFVGVAPRGPARAPVLSPDLSGLAAIEAALRTRRRSVPVPVDSWERYLTVFGGYEGPGRLPYAVASFFENGGDRVYVVRVVHDDGPGADPDAGCASAVLAGVTSSGAPPRLVARGEGSWGDALRARLGRTARALQINVAGGTSRAVALPDPQEVQAGSYLRLVRADPESPMADYQEMRFVRWIERRGAPDGARPVWIATLAGPPLPAPPTEADLVEGVLEISHEASGRSERFAGLGFSSDHGRWLAAAVFAESELALPTADWLRVDLTPDATPGQIAAAGDPGALDPPIRFSGGVDRYHDVAPEDMFDADWDPFAERPASGVHALLDIREIALIAVPDLYAPEPLAERPELEPPQSLANAEFAPCVDAASEVVGPLGEPNPDLPGLLLDPRDAGDRKLILGLQRRLVDLADRLRDLVVLLDVPPGLTERQILAWRAELASPFAAAYHPWLRTATPDDARDALSLLPPSAAAAGVIARQERLFGVMRGPANVRAEAVVATDVAVPPALHDRLHPHGVNVFRQERDGVWLTAARTLGRDPALRQLSVVRLLAMLRRVLRRQMRWTVFEPNGPALRADLRQQLRGFLRQLYRAGAFKGATEEEAFFVRCDEALNPPRITELGRLVAEIGVAPAEPLEFIVLRILRGADGTLSVEG